MANNDPATVTADSGFRPASARDLAQDTLGLWLIIDDNPDADQVLAVPISWGHRQLVDRDEADERYGGASPSARQLAFDVIALADAAGMPDTYRSGDSRMNRAYAALGFNGYDEWVDAGSPTSEEEFQAAA